MNLSFLRNTSLKTKILTIVIWPALTVIILAGLRIHDVQKEANDQLNLMELMYVSTAGGNLVHELQKERGYSAGFIKSDGGKFADALSKQRQKTDEKISAFQTTLEQYNTERFGAEYTQQVELAITKLSKMTQIRNQVSSQNISLKDSVQYYTAINHALLGITKKTLFVSQDPDLLREISAYLYFSESKERAGLERAVGSAGFATNWRDNTIARFSELITIQNNYMDVFLAYANEEERSFYNEKIKHTSFAAVQQMRDIAHAQSEGDYGQEISPELWFDTITQKINVLKSVEDHLAEDVLMVAEKGYKDALFSRNIFMTIQITLMIALMFIVYAVVQDLLQSLHKAKEEMDILANGDTNFEVSGLDRDDEVGDMAESIEQFRKNKIEVDRLEAKQKEMDEQARQYSDQLQAMTRDFDDNISEFLKKLFVSSTELQKTASQLTNLAASGAQQSNSLAHAASSSSENVNIVAATAEELSASISEINQQISRSNAVSKEAMDKANNAQNDVSRLRESSDKIGEVISLIQDIAEQTNLLALNATIEAARAGEAGKGFAVVASEVKSLANQTAQATDEISAQISKTQDETMQTVAVIEDVVKIIGEMNEISTSISAAMEEQAAAMGEIVRSTQSAATSTNEVSSAVEMVKSASEQTDESSKTLSEAAGTMSNDANDLRGEVERFLANVKAKG